MEPNGEIRAAARTALDVTMGRAGVDEASRQIEYLHKTASGTL